MGIPARSRVGLFKQPSFLYAEKASVPTCSMRPFQPAQSYGSILGLAIQFCEHSIKLSFEVEVGSMLVVLEYCTGRVCLPPG